MLALLDTLRVLALASCVPSAAAITTTTTTTTTTQTMPNAPSHSTAFYARTVTLDGNGAVGLLHPQKTQHHPPQRSPSGVLHAGVELVPLGTRDRDRSVHPPLKHLSVVGFDAPQEALADGVQLVPDRRPQGEHHTSGVRVRPRAAAAAAAGACGMDGGVTGDAFAEADVGVLRDRGGSAG